MLPHPGGAALVIIQGLINSARLNGASPADLATARTSLRTLMAVVNSASRREVNETETFTFTGSWLATEAAPAKNAGVWRQTFRSGDCVDVTFPPGDAYLVFAGTNNTSTSRVAVTDLSSAGAAIDAFPLGDHCVSSTAWTPCAYRAPLTARGHRLRFTHATGTGPLAVGALVPQLFAPSTVLMMKEPYLPDYAASAMFPHGSDEALDAFNALIDDLAIEFPNVIVADPNQPGYWNKLLHTQPDQVHPNEAGNAALARTALDALNRRARSAVCNSVGRPESSSPLEAAYFVCACACANSESPPTVPI
ncbi:hypothetical protein [Cryobacterium fucosi]|uniref:SGNH/GDSL hydrolase family protein n=1 Tax=Cryobacterium fucosi TaxID=1259157 RepID=A0A4R9BGV9_9MICO|nr:hypothetical protein [Cryobacterium fucosi]TFD82484.1 hypothetical protein E3T48_02120 [Cryobacterium fucosi]